MSVINILSTDRVTISGLPGTGKTTLAKYLGMVAEPNLLIYDPLDQYTQFGANVRYIPRTDSLDEFEAVCKSICSRGNLVFLVEEAEKYMRQGQVLGPYATDVMNRGRNWGVGVIAVTRRIQMLNKNYFDLCKHVFFYKCGMRSYKYIEEMTSQQTVQRIRTLQPFHFLHKDLETEEETVGYLELKRKTKTDDVDLSHAGIALDKAQVRAQAKTPDKTKDKVI